MSKQSRARKRSFVNALTGHDQRRGTRKIFRVMTVSDQRNEHGVPVSVLLDTGEWCATDRLKFFDTSQGRALCVKKHGSKHATPAPSGILTPVPCPTSRELRLAKAAAKFTSKEQRNQPIRRDLIALTNPAAGRRKHSKGNGGKFSAGPVIE